MWSSFGKLVEQVSAQAVGVDAAGAAPSETPGWDSFRARLTSGIEAADSFRRAGPAATASGSLLKSLAGAAIDAVDRKVKQAHLPAAAADDVRLALLATRLSDAAYAQDDATLQEALTDLPEGLDLDLLRFRVQPTPPPRQQQPEQQKQQQQILTQEVVPGKRA